MKKPKDKKGKAEAVCEAVDECIREGILKEFLLRNKGEVVAMSIFEYDEEKEKELLRKAEYENGVQQGICRGKDIGGQLKLISQVCKKMKKGKAIKEIAEELEEDEAVVEKIYNIAKEAALHYDAEMILAKMEN